MKRYIIAGVSLLALDIAVLIFFWEWRMLPAITGITAVPFIFLAGLIMEAFRDPDSQHIDIQESSFSRQRKTMLATRFLVIALPSLLVCISSFIFFYW